VQEAGWDAVDSLYLDPPVSTEQILHPEKYAAGETYAELADPADAARDGGPLDGWRLLRSNALGELQWRIVFTEHGQGDIAELLAAGWDGDRYAVFERDGEILMAMTTHWDTEDDAKDFEAGYYEVQGAKGLPADAARLVDQRGRFVAVVEGGDADLAAEVMAFMRTANGD